MVYSMRGYIRGWQVKLCDPLTMCAIPERFYDEVPPPRNEVLYQVSITFLAYFLLTVCSS